MKTFCLIFCLNEELRKPTTQINRKITSKNKTFGKLNALKKRNKAKNK